MEMPIPNPEILSSKLAIVALLQAVLPDGAVIHAPVETRAYECDALTAYRCPPLAVVLPETTAQVSEVLKICHREGVPVVPRGSGTSLAGNTFISCKKGGDIFDGGGIYAKQLPWNMNHFF